MPRQRRQSEANRKLNLWISRLIPLLLVGAIGYSAWVVTKLLCIDYLLRPPPGRRRKETGVAIAILVIYYVLVVTMLVCYGRLIDSVVRTPGVVPRGRQWLVAKERQGQKEEGGGGENGQSRSRSRRRRRSGSRSGEKSWDSEDTMPVHTGCDHSVAAASRDELRVEDYWLRDVFTCKFDGRPEFCSMCYNWKPDRSHHCKELNRCVLKMDHFCPWVGGVVGETSFKFFVQFTFWAALFCFHCLVSMAYFLAQRKHDEGTINANWAVTLGLASLFFLFSACMCASSLQFVCINSTTIENISRKSKIWYLAIYIPDRLISSVQEAASEELRLITYPRPESEQLQLLRKEERAANGSIANGSLDLSAGQVDQRPTGPLRTFGIFPTQAGEIPWDDGVKSNFMQVMGYNVWEWLFPIRRSPCTDHSSMVSFYTVGKVVEQMKSDAGISGPTSKKVSRLKGEKRQRRRRRASSLHHSSTRRV